MPANGVVDESIWEKAKKAVKKSDYPDDNSYYAVVSTVYKNMGGKYSKEASKYSEIIEVLGCDQTPKKDSIQKSMKPKKKETSLDSVKTLFSD
jgi:hypothetical protein